MIFFSVILQINCKPIMFKLNHRNIINFLYYTTQLSYNIGILYYIKIFLNINN